MVFTATARLQNSILVVFLLVVGACGDTGTDEADRAEHLLAAGVEALEAGDFDRAWPLCDAAWRLQPEASGALRCAALAAVGWTRWDLAVSALHAMLEESPSQEEDPWVWITLWLARVKTGDRAGAARVVEELGTDPAAMAIRRGILALALAKGVESPEWGFSREEVETWGGVLPLIWAGRNLPADRRPFHGKPDDVEAAGYLALVAALDGQALEAPSETPGVSASSMALLNHYLGPDDHGCVPLEGLPEEPRVRAAAAHLRAICLERSGETEAALAGYDEAVALASWHRTARLNRALLLARMGRFLEARVELEQLSVEAQDHPILKVLEGLMVSVDGDEVRAAAVRSEVEDLAPAYGKWMDEVLAE